MATRYLTPIETGRPRKPIDWARVDQLLEAGCPATEIAPHFNMCADRFRRRVEKEFGIRYTEYAATRHKRGDSRIREKQFEKALNGDNTLLIWLGKNRLSQSDNPAVEAAELKVKSMFEEFLQMVTSPVAIPPQNNENNQQSYEDDYDDE